jgi:hypothetical protein
VPNLESPINVPIGSTVTQTMFNTVDITTYNTDCASRIMVISGLDSSYATELDKVLTISPTQVGTSTFTVTYVDNDLT